MKQTKLLPALLLLTCLTLPLAACGASSDGQTEASGGFDSAPMASASPEYPDAEYDAPLADASFPTGGSYYENTKVILTADLSLQATDFDGAVAALDDLVTAQNGYYESSEYTYGGYYSTGNRWGYFTIRVPREHYQAFLSGVGDVAHVSSRTTSTQDVGEAYYDAELHLATLQTKHERLLDLLAQATMMEDIISLESALSDVEYQIQQYSSTLTRYDGLIDFATIHLDLQEVVRVTDNPTESAPLSARIGAAFTDGWNNFCDGMAGFAVWAAYNFMGIIIFLAAAAVAIVLVLRLRPKRNAIPAPKRPDEPKDESK